MLIAPFIDGGITLKCELPVTSSTYIDLTGEVLRIFGVEITDVIDKQRTITIPQTRITHREIDIEPDASSAVYFAAVAALHDGMAITLEGLSLESSQPDMEAIRLLGTIGAEVIDVENGIRVTGTGVLHGFDDLDASGFPDASLCMAAVAAFADSPSRIFGLETLPLKESDRIEVMARSLAKSGVWSCIKRYRYSDITHAILIMGQLQLTQLMTIESLWRWQFWARAERAFQS